MSETVNSDVVSCKPFDLEEAAVLLDVYLSIKRKGSTNTQAAQIASERLRSLAAKPGMKVDDAFRSPMGLQNRLRSVGNIYEGHESESAPGTQIFREIVDLYKNNREEYQHLLTSAGIDFSNVPATKNRKKIDKTKFVRLRKDQSLKEKYGASFSRVYYALKNGAKGKADGVTSMDLFLALGKSVRRKDIADILDNASWSRKVSDTHYLFFDKEYEERKQKQMDELLKAAERDFFAWLPSAISPSTLEEVSNTYKTVSVILVQKKALPQSLMTTTQIGQVESALKLVKKVFGIKKLRSGATKLLTAYAQYLREKKNTVAVKSESKLDIKEDWIRFDFTNAQDFERTVPVYCSINGGELTGRNWARILVGIAEQEIAKNNPALESLYKQSLMANKKDRPFFLKKGIDGLNCSELSNGYWVNVNYSIPRLMEQIRALCLHCGYTKSQIIIYGVPKGSSSAKSYKADTTKISGNGVAIEKAEEFLKAADLKGAKVQELIDAVQPGAAVYPTKNALEASENVIEMPNGRYVHVDAFVDLDEAEEDMKGILQTHFAQFGGYSNNKLLFGAASHDLSMFLNDNDCEDIDSVYALAQYFFSKKNGDEKFTFSYPHIFENNPDYPLTLKGLMINFARMNDGLLTADEAKNYLQKTMLRYGSLNQLLAVSSSDTFLMYDSDRYLLTEKLGINAEWKQAMHDKLDGLFLQANVAFIIPRDINQSWLNSLPALPHGLGWTVLLLQEVLRHYPDIGFRPVTSELGQTIDTIAAAIVPKDSPVQSFPDVVTLFMQERHTLPMRMTCEELRIELRNAGMLEKNELIYALPKALDDYRFSWTDENRMVLVRGN